MSNTPSGLPPAYLVELVPAAVDALAKYREMKSGPPEPLTEERAAARKAADDALALHTRESDAFRAAQRRFNAAQHRIEAHQRATEQARTAVWEAVWHHPDVPASPLRAAAAERALEADATAREAWATLRRALAERDNAHKWAGAPGRPTEELKSGSGADGADYAMRQILPRYVEHFDATATRAVAESGEPVAPRPTPDLAEEWVKRLPNGGRAR